MIVFDLTSTQSLEAVDRYIHNFREECPKEAQDNIVLVGTKLDESDKRQVSAISG